MTYLQHGNKFRLRDAHPVSVTAVHHVDDSICVGVVTTPVWPGRERYKGLKERDEDSGGGRRAEASRPNTLNCKEVWHNNVWKVVLS